MEFKGIRHLRAVQWRSMTAIELKEVTGWLNRRKALKEEGPEAMEKLQPMPYPAIYTAEGAAMTAWTILWQDSPVFVIVGSSMLVLHFLAALWRIGRWFVV